MAVILAHFHSSGSFPVSSEVLKFFARGMDIVVFLFLIISAGVDYTAQEILKL